MSKRFEESDIIRHYFERLLPQEINVRVFPNLKYRVFELCFTFFFDKTWIHQTRVLVYFSRWKQFLNKQGYYLVKEIRDGYAKKIK